MVLSKSEFIKGRECHQKVIYQRGNYPSVNDRDVMGNEMANVGHIVHHLAGMMFPNSVYRMPLQELLSMDGMTGREIDLRQDKFQARADIISITNDVLTLTEIKSKKHPTKDEQLTSLLKDSGEPYSGYENMFADITFQALILRDLVKQHASLTGGVMPELRYELMLMNPDFTTGHTTLRQLFDVRDGIVRHHHVIDEQELLSMFIRIDVTSTVNGMLVSIEEERNAMYDRIVAQQPGVLTSKCKNCEYRTSIFDEGPCGFRQCWGEKAYHFPQILDVPSIGNLSINGQDAVQVIANQGTCYVQDIPLSILKSGSNNLQARVIDAYLSKQEHQEPMLQQILSSRPGPHVFIDFEAYNGALSLWNGGKAYEITAFQFSVHTLDADGEMHHQEWLHEGKEHPAADFLTSLYHAVEGAGTIYIWSSYELTAIAYALSSVNRLGMHLDDNVRQWAEKEMKKDNPLVVDMNELCRQYYVHPLAYGSTSIKDVLNAIWRENYEAFLPTFEKYFRKEEDYVFKPYNVLPMNYGSAVLASITNGGDAVIGYLEMMHGRGNEREDVRANVRSGLLAYCELDTAAMVIIYKHWTK